MQQPAIAIEGSLQELRKLPTAANTGLKHRNARLDDLVGKPLDVGGCRTVALGILELGGGVTPAASGNLRLAVGLRSC